MKPKQWTGERLETFVSNENTIEHLHRYALACEYVKEKVVLDIACGEGYGSLLLAKTSKIVFGVDIDKDSIDAATLKYKKDNLQFIESSATHIPLEDDSIDIVVSFETIEHLEYHDQMLSEIKRVLKQDGLLIMSSPDKYYYSDLRHYSNPFHVKELYALQFKSLIKQHFTNTQFLTQGIIFGSLVHPECAIESLKTFSGDFTRTHTKEYPHQPIYNIVLASDERIKNMGLSFFDGENILQLMLEYNQGIIHKQNQLFRQSWRYKIGSFFVAPFSLIKKYIIKWISQ